VNEICELPLETTDVDVKAELIQMLIPIGLLQVKKLLYTSFPSVNFHILHILNFPSQP